VTIHADASIRAGLFDGAERIELALDPKRLTYVHVARGALRVNGHAPDAGDALMLERRVPARKSTSARATPRCWSSTWRRSTALIPLWTRGRRSVAFHQPFEGALA
jgi:hypothetical protein